MRSRKLNEVYANLLGYFWLPCPICGQEFGGHEATGMAIYPEGEPLGRVICEDCTKEGLDAKFYWDPDEQTAKMKENGIVELHRGSRVVRIETGGTLA